MARPDLKGFKNTWCLDETKMPPIGTPVYYKIQGVRAERLGYIAPPYSEHPSNTWKWGVARKKTDKRLFFHISLTSLRYTTIKVRRRKP